MQSVPVHGCHAVGVRLRRRLARWAWSGAAEVLREPEWLAEAAVGRQQLVLHRHQLLHQPLHRRLRQNIRKLGIAAVDPFNSLFVDPLTNCFWSF